MDQKKIELVAQVETANASSDVADLNALELTLIGGGYGEITF
jgi:hypothetical protein